jgi:hypothetical protein
VVRGGLEVADVFRHFGPAFRDQHGASLSSAQRHAMTGLGNAGWGAKAELQLTNILAAT